MKLHLTIFLSIICCVNCILYSINVTKPPTEKDWKQYKSDFNKAYHTKADDQKRFKIFKQNWIHVHNHNKRYAKGMETYLQEINKFADITEKEFAELYSLVENDKFVKYDQEVKINKTISDNSTDDYLNWKEAGAVGPTQDQGRCGASWAFSAVGLLESYHFRKTGKLLDFSEQYIVDCKSKNSCATGSPDQALQFVKENGIHLESNYPYRGKQNNCTNISVLPLKIYFKNAYIIIGDDDDLKEEVKEQGPLVVCLYASSQWMFYKSGVWYHNDCSSEVNHCLLLVGYGTENSNDYWLFKNSWGHQWGQDGFIKLARNRHQNYCGINTALYLQ